MAALKQLLEVPFEGFGRSPADKAFLRRQNQPGADAFLVARHGAKPACSINPLWFR